MFTRALVVTVVAILPSIAMADPICHRTSKGAFSQIDIAPAALAAHYNHGDATPFTLYRDADADGVGTSADTIEACSAVPGYVTTSGDIADNLAFLTSPVDIGGIWTVTLSTDTWSMSEPMLLWGTTEAFSSNAFDAVTEPDGTILANGYFEGGITAQCLGAWVSIEEFYVDCPVGGIIHVRLNR